MAPKPQPQPTTLNDGNFPRQSGTSIRRPSDPEGLRVPKRGNGFTEVQDPSGQGDDYSELLHQDIGEGTFTAEQLRQRNIARHTAHNAAVASRNAARGVKGK